jgi:opacity protein-like surface antigen
MKTQLLLNLTACALIAPAVAAEAVKPEAFFDFKSADYSNENGVVTLASGSKHLQSKKEYANYIFSFEFKVPPAGNSGIGIHVPKDSRRPAYDGIEVQVLDDSAEKYADLKPYQFHGSLYELSPALKGSLKPQGEWNKETITVYGNQMTVNVNGTIVNQVNLDTLAEQHPEHAGVKRRSGHIVICSHQDPVQFRNFQMKELQETGSLPKVDLTGFKKIYNEKDLSGWKHEEGHIGHWQPQGEVLSYDGKATAKDKNLWTDKAYSDVTMVVDWRWSGPAPYKKRQPVLDPNTGETKRDANGKPMLLEIDEYDSGIYFRGNNRSQVNLWNWSCGSGEVYGYRMNRKHPAEVRAALVPKFRTDHPIGEWNRMVISLIGDRLTVAQNGITVIENAQLPGVPAEGPIALQHHGSGIDFKNISIKEH